MTSHHRSSPLPERPYHPGPLNQTNTRHSLLKLYPLSSSTHLVHQQTNIDTLTPNKTIEKRSRCPAARDPGGSAPRAVFNPRPKKSCELPSVHHAALPACAHSVFNSQEDYDKAKMLLSDATKSRAYLYPIKGLVYFLSRPSIWKPLAGQIVPYLLLSVSVVAAMFFFTYLPQLALLIFVNGPLAVFTTVILILNESATIVNVLSRTWLLRDALVDTFDGTLVSKNMTGIVEEGRELRPGATGADRLGRLLKTPFQKFSLKAVVRYIMYLPLNFIPIIGTFVFLLVQGGSSFVTRTAALRSNTNLIKGAAGARWHTIV